MKTTDHRGYFITIMVALAAATAFPMCAAENAAGSPAAPPRIYPERWVYVSCNLNKDADVEEIRQDLGAEIVAATGVMSNFDRIPIGGKQQDVKVIGTDQEYQPVRNIVISSGRFLDESDVTLRAKVALLTDKLAERMYSSRASALGQVGKPGMKPR